MQILLIVAGAALGALARYFLGGFATSGASGGFPWGTLIVNLSGCLLIGLAWGFCERMDWPVSARSFVFVGIISSFTTFSSFGLETLRLFEGGAAGQAVIYVLVSNLAGIGLVWAGLSAVRSLAA